MYTYIYIYGERHYMYTNVLTEREREREMHIRNSLYLEPSDEDRTGTTGHIPET